MRFSSLVVRAALLAAAAFALVPLSSLSQTFAANTGPDVVITPSAETSPAKITAGRRHHGVETQMYGRVRDGVYTVDGMVAKLKLNYDVDAANYLYLFVPGVGTAVISAVAPKDAVVTEAHLQGNELTFTVGDHAYKLTGVALAVNHGATPNPLYVHLDRSAWALSRRPMVGFGNLADAPYQWPGALTAGTPTDPETAAVAPPLPVTLLPSATPVHVRTSAPSAAQPATLTPVAMR